MPITSNFAHWRSKLAKLPCTCKISVTSSFLQRNARAQATNSRPIQCNLLKKFLSTLAERPVPPRTCSISLEKVNKLSVHGHRQQQSKRTNRTTEERESSYCKLQHQQILQPKFNMYQVHREPAKWQSKQPCPSHTYDNGNKTATTSIANPRTGNPKQPCPSRTRENGNNNSHIHRLPAKVTTALTTQKGQRR